MSMDSIISKDGSWEKMNHMNSPSKWTAVDNNDLEPTVKEGSEVSITLSVPTVKCVSCIRYIQDRVKPLPGVSNVWVDLDTRQAIIRYHENLIQPHILKTVIESAGYKVEGEEDHEIGDNRVGGKVDKIRPPLWRSLLIGLAAASAVIAFYVGLMTLTSDWFYARYQFDKYQWWIIALAVGLGIQATLYAQLRGWLHGKSKTAAKSGLAASGGMSTGAMAACCAHYLVAVLPALGWPFLTAAAAGLERYQTIFFLIGVLSNLFGILLMIRILSKNGLISFESIKIRLGFAPRLSA